MEKNTPAVRTKLTEALEQINDQLQGIKTISETPYKTGGAITMYGNDGTYDIQIQKVKDSEKLLEIYAFLLNKEKSYVEAAKDLNISTIPAPRHNKLLIADLKYDIKLRMAVVSQHEKEAALHAAKSKLETFLTAEDQLAITLNQLGFGDYPQ